MSSIIQANLPPHLIVRNEHKNDDLLINKGDIVIFDRTNPDGILYYAEFKWFFSHHLFKDSAWRYKRQKKKSSHNHHFVLKSDINKLITSKIGSAYRILFVLVTHPHILNLPAYWADYEYHENCFSNISREPKKISETFSRRLNQVLTSSKGLEKKLKLGRIEDKLSTSIFPLTTPDNIPVTFFVSNIDFSTRS